MSATETQVPVVVIVTPFRIIRRQFGKMAPEYSAEWASGHLRGRQACGWRYSRDAVRMSMTNLYADIREVRGEE